MNSVNFTSLFAVLNLLSVVASALGSNVKRGSRGTINGETNFMSHVQHPRDHQLARDTEERKCGKRNGAIRIVGGVETEVHEYPWQAIVRCSGAFCGGSIIAEDTILTAAHCVLGRRTSSVKVTIGEHNVLTKEEPNMTQDFLVSKIIVYPDYDPNTLYNDIALLKLSSAIKFQPDNSVAPVCLPTINSRDESGNATVTGWGTTSEGGRMSPSLREVEVPLIASGDCQRLYPTEDITKNVVCAGYTEGGKDSCQGDSGGPLVKSDENGNLEQIGIVSWGNGCARPNLPGVYTRVKNYLDWIQTIIAWRDIQLV